MTSQLKITPEAYAAASEAYRYHKAGMNPSSAMRAALASALPFCKRIDDGARLHLFDGRFTLPLVVKSYPGVSFIHPADVESAPVCVITCDDHPTVAAGIVDAIKAAHDAHVVRGGAPHCLCGDNDGKWCSLPGCPYEKPTNVEIKNGAAFMRANGEAMKTIRAACGSSLDKSWAEKARVLFGDQKRSTLLVIGSALAKIAEALPGRVHIEVGYPDEVAEAPAPTVTVNLSVNSSSVDPEFAQKAADEVRRAVEKGLQPSAAVKVACDIPAQEYADTSHMSGYTEGGVPRHGGAAMRQGWRVGANPWFRKDGSLAWEASLWLAQYHFDNAECMKSHIEGEGFKPLPPVQGIG